MAVAQLVQLSKRGEGVLERDLDIKENAGETLFRRRFCYWYFMVLESFLMFVGEVA